MIKKILFSILVFSFEFLFSQSSIKSIYTEAKLNSVSVYQQSAELFASTQVKVPKGSSELVITNIANNIDESTIKIGTSNKSSVLTYQFTDNAINDVLDKQNPKHKVVMDSIVLLQKEIKKLNFEKSSIGQSMLILDKNMEVKSSGLSFTIELSKLVDYYQKKRGELHQQSEILGDKIDKFQEKLIKLQNRFSSNAKEIANYPKGKIVLQLNSEIEETLELKIRYSITDASWQPYYDVIVKSTKDKIEMVQKALIRQNSGLDWRNVNLQLVSGQANQHKSIPILQAWELSYLQAEAPLAASSFRMKTMNAEAVSADYEENKSVGIEINQNQLNQSYDLQDKFTILSNNKDNSILLDKSSVDASFNYFAIPKATATAYLIAEIPNLDQYNFVKANANIIFQDTNVGKTLIDPETTENNMQLTLGDDKRIAVKRNLIKEKSFKKNVSNSNNEQQFAYEIVVKNNKSEKINILIKDQIPISTDKQIIINLIDAGDAEVNDQGELKWNLKIAANETKKLRFTYKINYLKNKILIGL